MKHETKQCINWHKWKPLILENLPEEMREVSQWVGWRWGKVRSPNGKRGKIPVNPNNGMNASVVKAESWGTFDQAVEAVDQFGLAGIGFVFTNEDEYCGIDLDNCRNPETGEIDQWAKEICEKFTCYTEVSASETGLHILCRAKLPRGSGNRKGVVEIYDHARFFVVTGMAMEV
ncbi:MAG: hypothetical protein H7834_05610 [Magnetococcus sp. YQC-9]